MIFMQSADVDNGFIYIKEDRPRRHSSDYGISGSVGSAIAELPENLSSPPQPSRSEHQKLFAPSLQASARCL